MIRQTLLASDQVKSLLDSYLERGRYAAYRNLLKSILDATEQIEAAPSGGASYPRPYPKMAKWGYRWIKVHRYWFGWSIRRGYPVITNVLFETSRIWGRVEPDEGDEIPL